LLEVLFKGNLHNFLLQIEKLEQEIQEKRKQMRGIEQRIIESGETSVANSSLVEMQQVAIFI
jgi:centromeric protein E